MTTAKVKNKSLRWIEPLGGIVKEHRGVQLLTGLLAVQLVISGDLLWSSNAQHEFALPEQLITFDSEAVNEILIEEADANVTLTLDENHWKLNDDNATMASVEKVNELLASLNAVQAGLPVASKVSSHAQLAVADDDFQRRIQLKSNSQVVADLYLGTSPGFRKSHARQVGEDAVYAVKLSALDVPASQDDWLDRNVLAFSDVSAIAAEDINIELEKVDDQWAIAQSPSQSKTHEIDEAALEAFAGTLASLSVIGFAEELVPKEIVSNEIGLGEPVNEASDSEALSDASVAQEGTESDTATASDDQEVLAHEFIVTQNDSPIRITMTKKGSDATIRRSDVSGLFSLPVSTFDALSLSLIHI